MRRIMPKDGARMSKGAFDGVRRAAKAPAITKKQAAEEVVTKTGPRCPGQLDQFLETMRSD